MDMSRYNDDFTKKVLTKGYRDYILNGAFEIVNNAT